MGAHASFRKDRTLGADPGLEETTLAGARGPYVGQPGGGRIRRFFHEPGLNRIFLALESAYGPQTWWPARTPFEVMVGAVLTQNTSWRNVELALEQLARHAPLTPDGILALPREHLELAIRSSGTYRAKARKLKALSRWYLEVGGLRSLREQPLEEIRAALLGVHGVGPETADSILCYAAGRRTAIVDAYTRRLLLGHGYGVGRAPYEEIRGFLQARLVRSQRVYEEFHALAVRVGSDHCKPRPRCERCPAEACALTPGHRI